ncbi:DUF6538 domain-containing protein [Pseudogemmobacter bohemicus]|uniref:DUF6538 domain-containing protein n=1 Tax=Pseudogemmobacter bohemicus TaxID=2250708 RepID=UPI002FCDC72F
MAAVCALKSMRWVGDSPHGVTQMCHTFPARGFKARLFLGAVMGKHLHLFRRGAVLCWRRRVPELSTSINMLQLSLRTGMRAEACMIARKLTVESDRMLTRNLISAEAARTWLSHLITEALAPIRRLDRVTRLDPLGRAASDIRADRATATAWRLMAGHGPRGRS